MYVITAYAQIKRFIRNIKHTYLYSKYNFFFLRNDFDESSLKQ